MLFDARDIARSWLTVNLASGKDKDRPILDRTIHIEQHPDGVRLVATDSHMLLHSYVPGISKQDRPEPGIDEVPVSTAVAWDPHGRARGFFAHVLKLATQAENDDSEPIEIRLSLNVRDTATRGQSVFAGMEAHSVVVEQPDVERLQLVAMDGTYPPWRPVLGNYRGVATETVALQPDIVGRLAKVGRIIPFGVLGWHFGGSDRAAKVEVLGADPYVEGVVMPCRWDMVANAPADDGGGDGDDG